MSVDIDIMFSTNLGTMLDWRKGDYGGRRVDSGEKNCECRLYKYGKMLFSLHLTQRLTDSQKAKYSVIKDVEHIGLNIDS